MKITANGTTKGEDICVVNANALEKHKVCAVIVSFHPDKKFPQRLDSILAHVDSVVIVDNCSNSAAFSMIEQIIDNERTFLISNKVNLGIAKALNQAMKWAVNRKYDWVWTFDQDTQAPSNMFASFEKAYNHLKNKYKIGMIAPNYFDIHSETYYVPIHNSFAPRSSAINRYAEAEDENILVITEKASVISSGSLISLSAFRVVGKFEEKFFIDWVDHDYCLRIYQRGFVVILLRQAVLKHAMGKATKHRLLHKSVITSNHSPLRRYYWSRNGFSLMLRYIKVDFPLALDLVKIMAKSVIVILSFEKQRLAKIKYLVLGIYDALTHNFKRNLSRNLSDEV